MSFYRYSANQWKKVYRKTLKPADKKKIMKAFMNAFAANQYSDPKKVWGNVIEDRDTQITFSALGQKAPVAAKKKWNAKYNPLRLKMAKDDPKGTFQL